MPITVGSKFQDNSQPNRLQTNLGAVSEPQSAFDSASRMLLAAQTKLDPSAPIDIPSRKNLDAMSQLDEAVT